MDSKGDIPSRTAVKPPGALSDNASAKVETVREILEAGGVAHVYLDSVDGGDLHLYGFNTRCFSERGWVYVHADDEDMWIPGDDIGAIERHYEK